MYIIFVFESDLRFLQCTQGLCINSVLLLLYNCKCIHQDKIVKANQSQSGLGDHPDLISKLLDVCVCVFVCVCVCVCVCVNDPVTAQLYGTGPEGMIGKWDLR